MQIYEDKYFRFYNHFVIVKGAFNGLIINTRTNKFLNLQIDLLVLFQAFESKKVKYLIGKFSTDEIGILAKYLDFFIKQNYGFITSNENFKSIPILSPDIITIDQIIVTISKLTQEYLQQIIYAAIELNSNLIYLDVCLIDIDNFIGIDFGNLFLIISIDISVFNLNKDRILSIDSIREIELYNSNVNTSYEIKDKFHVIETVKKQSHISCGVVSSQWFVSSMNHINLAKSKNSCLYGKISIDTEGNIKNCPSMSESYGNIKDTTLVEALEKPGFKKFWNITKDSINKCKDCEFRYICTDCRAYTTDPEDMYSDPLKCGYDPYTGEWEDWSKNPLKQKAIDFYGMREMVNKEKPSQ